MTVAVVGAGRMGSVVAEQLPENVGKLLIDRDREAAERAAARVGGTASADYAALSDAAVVFLVLPAPVIPAAAEAAAGYVKPGAVILNMSTKGAFPEDIRERYPSVSFIDAKIIGHAASMREGAPCLVVVGTEDEALFETVRGMLPGYAHVVMGDASLVPVLSTIATTEGIRAAVRVKQEALKHGIPEEWLKPLVYTVAAGSMRAYINGDMGEFARKIAEQFEREG